MTPAVVILQFVTLRPEAPKDLAFILRKIGRKILPLRYAQGQDDEPGLLAQSE